MNVAGYNRLFASCLNFVRLFFSHKLGTLDTEQSGGRSPATKATLKSKLNITFLLYQRLSRQRNTFRFVLLLETPTTHD